MDTSSFEVVRDVEAWEHRGDDGQWYLQLFVNERPFVDLVREAERPLATATGEPHLAGAYAPLALVSDLPLEKDRFLGKSASLFYAEEPRMTFLVCGCGEDGCWPLHGRITVDEVHVCWTAFGQPHRPAWEYSNFGPFVFERTAYEAELRTLSDYVMACERSVDERNGMIDEETQSGPRAAVEGDHVILLDLPRAT